MPWQPLPLTGPAYRNVDDIGIQNGSVLLRNAFVNELKQTQSLPGLTVWADLGTNKPVIGLYEWVEQNLIFAVSDGKIYRIPDAFGSIAFTGTTSFVTSDTPISFTNDINRVYFANGGKIEFATTSTIGQVTDADAPQNVTHLVFLDQYIIANKRASGQWQFSNVGDGLTWRAMDIFTAEAFPDNLLGIYRKFDEIILVGQQSMEFWIDDGVSPFSRVPGTTIKKGMASPHAMAIIDDTPIWLSQEREVLVLNGRETEPVSIPIQKELRDLSDASDAVAFSVQIGTHPFFVLTFPNANRTFAYNIRLQDWGEWSRYNPTAGKNEAFPIASSLYSQNHNLHLIGDNRTGLIYKIDPASFTFNGEPIQVQRRTGFINHGTSTRKSSRAIRITLSRGAGLSGGSPTLRLRWRDKLGPWSNGRFISLGNVGDTDPIITITQLGSYRVRQYEITMTDAANFYLVGAEEFVEPLISTQAGRG